MPVFELSKGGTKQGIELRCGQWQWLLQIDGAGLAMVVDCQLQIRLMQHLQSQAKSPRFRLARCTQCKRVDSRRQLQLSHQLGRLAPQLGLERMSRVDLGNRIRKK